MGDIDTHAAHLAQFVSGLTTTDLRAEFHVCGAPRVLEDTAFATLRFNKDIPGMFKATRLTPGNRGGLRLRIFGSLGGLVRDMEDRDRQKLNVFGELGKVLNRGLGHGMTSMPNDWCEQDALSRRLA
ncbi:Gfo/Idh/MocA family oxidoreductase [Labrenzia sp. DG1229]|uniref:Gfo/Idh/MocA family protein n=1 Tax=Labrenzia sp. DG1229 TaxID=681847 RepID=UPI0004912494|nr:Gfo/Idh/MocA family oxidoreductase [Labrenzia sp. DG1229]